MRAKQQQQKQNKNGVSPEFFLDTFFLFFQSPGKLMDNVYIIFHLVADFIIIEILPVDYCNCA